MRSLSIRFFRYNMSGLFRKLKKPGEPFIVTHKDEQIAVCLPISALDGIDGSGERPHLSMRFHKTLTNPSAPSGTVDMYEFFDTLTGRTWMSVGLDTNENTEHRRARTILSAMNAQKLEKI